MLDRWLLADRCGRPRRLHRDRGAPRGVAARPASASGRSTRTPPRRAGGSRERRRPRAHLQTCCWIPVVVGASAVGHFRFYLTNIVGSKDSHTAADCVRADLLVYQSKLNSQCAASSSLKHARVSEKAGAPSSMESFSFTTRRYP